MCVYMYYIDMICISICLCIFIYIYMFMLVTGVMNIELFFNIIFKSGLDVGFLQNWVTFMAKTVCASPHRGADAQFQVFRC